MPQVGGELPSHLDHLTEAIRTTQGQAERSAEALDVLQQLTVVRSAAHAPADHYQKVLGEGGAVQWVVHRLATHSDNSEVVCAACDALSNLLCGYPPGVEVAVRECSIVTVLKNAVHLHFTNPQVAVASALLLQHLSAVEEGVSALVSGRVPALLVAMCQTHASVASFTAPALEVLVYMAHLRPASLTEVSLEGGLPAAVTALRKHPNHLSIVRSALSILLLIAGVVSWKRHGHGSRARSRSRSPPVGGRESPPLGEVPDHAIVLDNGEALRPWAEWPRSALKTLLRTVEINAYHAPVAELGAKLLASVCRDPANCGYVVERGGMSLVHSLLTSHANEGVLAEALHAAIPITEAALALPASRCLGDESDSSDDVVQHSLRKRVVEDVARVIAVACDVTLKHREASSVVLLGLRSMLCAVRYGGVPSTVPFDTAQKCVRVCVIALALHSECGPVASAACRTLRYILACDQAAESLRWKDLVVDEGVLPVHCRDLLLEVVRRYGSEGGTSAREVAEAGIRGLAVLEREENRLQAVGEGRWVEQRDTPWDDDMKREVMEVVGETLETHPTPGVVTAALVVLSQLAAKALSTGKQDMLALLLLPAGCGMLRWVLHSLTHLQHSVKIRLLALRILATVCHADPIFEDLVVPEVIDSAIAALEPPRESAVKDTGIDLALPASTLLAVLTQSTAAAPIVAQHAKGVGILLNALAVYRRSAEVVESILCTIHNVTGHEDLRRALAQHSTADAVLRGQRDHPTVVNIQLYGLQVLRALSDASVRDRAVQHNVIGMIIRTLREHIADEAVCEEGCAAIRCFAVSDDPHSAVEYSSEAIKAVLEVADHHPHNAVIAYHAVWVIEEYARHLAARGAPRGAPLDHCIECSLCAIRIHQGDDEIETRAVRGLGYLSCLANPQQLLLRGTVGTVLESARRHLRSEHLLKGAMRVWRQLLSHTGGKNTPTKPEVAGMLQVLLSAVQYHGHPAGVCRDAYGVLRMLCKPSATALSAEEMKHLLLDSKALDVSLAVLRDRLDDVKVVQEACSCIHFVAGRAKDVLLGVRCEDRLAVLVAAAKRYPKNAQIVEAVILTLDAVCQGDPRACKALAGVAPWGLWCSLAVEHKSMKAVITAACAICTALATEGLASDTSDMVAEGADAAVVFLTSHPDDPEVAAGSLAVLHAVCTASYPAHFATLIGGGAALQLVRAVGRALLVTRRNRVAQTAGAVVFRCLSLSDAGAAALTTATAGDIGMGGVKPLCNLVKGLALGVVSAASHTPPESKVLWLETLANMLPSRGLGPLDSGTRDELPAAVLRAMETHLDDASLHHPALLLLRTYAEHAVHKINIVAEGGAKVLLDVGRLHLGDVELQNMVLQTIQLLVTNADNQVVFVRDGFEDYAACLAKDADEHLCRQARHILKHLPRVERRPSRRPSAISMR